MASFPQLRFIIVVIKLLDVFYYDYAVNLIVQDLFSGVKHTVIQCLECNEVPFHWMLLDSSYLFKQLKGSEMPVDNQFKPHQTTLHSEK